MCITVSQGIAALDSNDTMDEFIRKADEALYLVKEGGRNRVESISQRNG